MKRTFIILAIGILALPYIATSQTWNGSTSSNWNTPANWTPNSVPGSGDVVIINNASATFQPELASDLTIATLNMSAGLLNLNGFTLTCTTQSTLTGDSLYNGKIKANTFNDLANMHLGGKIILEKTGASNEFWQGKNKFYGDSLIIIWKSGALHLENAAASPDSIFGNMKVQLTNAYSVYFSINSLLYVQNNLIVDNTGNGIFFLNGSHDLVIGGNLVAQNFSSSTPNLLFEHVTTLGNNTNGPFFSHTASVANCNFKGNFSLVADSSVTINITNSSFSGIDNLLQAGGIWTHDNKFGQTGSGTTIVRAAYNGTDANVRLRGGNNTFYGSAQWETFATWPGGITIEHNFYGNDTTLGNLDFILKGNAALVTNANGISYAGGNVVIDGQGARKWVQFTGGTGNYYIDGNFTVKNFTSFSEAGVGNTEVLLRNVYAGGTDTCGTFYCYTGDIQNSSFNGNFKLIADSAAGYNIANSSFLGADNLFQAHAFNAYNSRFGQAGPGTTILRSASKTAGSIYSRFGNNKFYGNAQLETYAAVPGGVTIQQNYYGKDSCWGNFSYILKGNAALVTNENGINYVAGNVVIDGQGARKWVQFTGGTGNYYIGGNFTVKNFTPYPDPGYPPSTVTSVLLRNIYASGTDTCGTFYCTTGDIQNSSFNGNFRLVADSSQGYVLANASFLGADNLFQAQGFNAYNSQFGQAGPGTTILRSANNTTSSIFSRFGNNKFYGNAQLETYAAVPGGVTIQQNYYGKDSCWGNFSYLLKGNAALVTNENGINYVAGNVVIDGQGARKLVQFTGGTGNYYIGGNFTAKNFTPYPEPGNLPSVVTSVLLRNVYAGGTDTCGTFYCSTGDIQNSSFNGSFKLIADSSQGYTLTNTSFLGADNLFQAGNLDFQNNSFGQAGSGTTVLRAAHNLTSVVLVREGNNRFLGNVQYEAYAQLPGGTTIQHTFYGKDSCFGNMTVNLNGSSNIFLGSVANLFLKKGLLLNNNSTTSGVIHNNGSTAIVFIGTDTADYTYSGSGIAPAIQNFVLNKQGGIRLQSPLSFTGALNFTRGIILSSLTNPVNIPAGALITAAWDSSYVEGPVSKTGNTAFDFPTGKNNVYAPVSITAPALITDVFRAQYFNSRAHDAGYDTTQHDLSLDHLSRREYWLLDRTNGAAAPKVTLSWKTARSGTVDVMAELRVARWNGTTWKDEGNGSISGTNASGTVQSLNNISNFSPFTLASVSVSNPLPVKYLYFTALLHANKTVLLQWKTAEEIGNSHFEVERSSDGSTWINLANIVSHISQVYVYTDLLPRQGMNYYRIKQVDNNGKFSYTPIKLVRISNDNAFFIWPNPVTTELHIQLPFENAGIKVFDLAGKLIFKNTATHNSFVLPTDRLQAGMYILVIESANKIYTEKFIKK